MSFSTLAIVALILAGIPFLLYLLNLAAYRPLPQASNPVSTPLSVLIPARNEEKNIEATLRSVLANTCVDFEVIVLNDHSTDRTGPIVAEIAARDPRVRLEEAPPLPIGWCGKQHACYTLARFARHPLLLFIDADVRLAPDALRRIVSFMEKRKELALASGVPRQELGSFSERLLLPLIHSVLLGCLSLHAMRRSRWPALSAGCGQLFVARHEAYEQCGGHSQLKDSLHDGIKLPRVFRRSGFPTDLFDATDVAVCRMYSNNAETWRGLEKNATEGLAAPGTIVPMSALLLGGQVLPFALLCALPAAPAFIVCAFLAALVPRLISARKFQQPVSSALLHPIGICALLFIQWRAFLKGLLGQPSTWKGRSYSSSRIRAMKGAAMFLLSGILLATAAEPARTPSPIELHDQFDAPQRLAFPTLQPVILTLADRKGSEQVEEWIKELRIRFAGKAEFRGIAQVSAVPRFLQGHIRKKFQEIHKYPVMMDWTGEICEKLAYKSGIANILLVDENGAVLARFEGSASTDRVKRACEILSRHLHAKEKP